jgi:hypothetical protein
MTDVVVFAAPGRDEAHRRCFASIEASDIGKNYQISMHPDGMHRDDHWRATHELAAQASSEFVLVLEDDVLVNRFILENVASWRWKLNKDFGAGWLYNPGGYAKKYDTWYSGARPWAMTPAVLYRTADLPRLIDIAWPKMKSGMIWDCAIAWAAEAGGKRIRVHFPSLAEHQNDVPSKLGNTNKSVLRTSGGTYRVDWRRPPGDPNGLVDRFGRAVNPNQR